jgi:HAD superfamily hydrolase (TIGR01509 family)
LIFDTESAEHQAWQEIYREFGSELPLERWLATIGTGPGDFDPCEQLERQLGELIDRDRIRRSHQERTATLLADRSVLPGITDFIDRGRELGLALAVASSSSRQWVEDHLARLDLADSFDVIRCVDDVDAAKPAPDLYLAVLEALDIAAESAIAIEDSPPGIAAAKAAGLYCISVPNALTRNLCMDAADLVLVSLKSLSLDEVLARARRRPAS